MSVLFPKVNKAPEWNWRPIYFDPKKDEMDRKLRALQQKRAAEEAAQKAAKGENSADDEPVSGYAPTLHRGSFREAREDAASFRRHGNRLSKTIFVVVLLMIVLAVYFLL